MQTFHENVPPRLQFRFGLIAGEKLSTSYVRRAKRLPQSPVYRVSQCFIKPSNSVH